MMDIFLAILLGSLFGFALFYVGATQSKNLISMLSLNNFTLMKTILFAIGFASFLLSLASLVGIFDVSHLSVKTTHLGVIIGGLIFGVGFGWAGTCPGTCVADSSSGGYKKALSAIIGGLVGAFLFSLSYGTIKSIGIFDVMNLGKLTLFDLSDKYPSVLSIGFGGLLIFGMIIMLIAYLLPVNPTFKKSVHSNG